MPVHSIKNLIFQGGSVKGVAYAGSLEMLQESGFDMRQIKRVAGTSAGAITALLLAVGLRVDEVKNLINDFDFKVLLDDKPGGISTRSKVLKTIGKQE